MSEEELDHVRYRIKKGYMNLEGGATTAVFDVCDLMGHITDQDALLDECEKALEMCEVFHGRVKLLEKLEARRKP